MTKLQTDCFKGILALSVILHHVLQHTHICALFSNCHKAIQLIAGDMVQYLGIFSVACFFFLSGYGLNISYERKGKMYARGMLINKILPFLCVIGISVTLYAIMFYIIGYPASIAKIVKTFGFGGGTVIINGWYLQSIVLLYALFAVIFSFQSISFQIKKVGIFFVVGIYITICIWLNLSTIWYQGVPAIVIGWYWKTIYDKIAKVSIWKFFIPMIVLRPIAFFTLKRGLLIPNTIWMLIFAIVWMIYIAIGVVVIMRIVNTKNMSNKFTLFFSSIYLELYITHGLFQKLYHSRIINIENGCLYGILVFASAILASKVIHPIFNYILTLPRHNNQ